MPYWKQDEEQALIHLVQEGADIDTMAEQLNRSSEAVRLKIRRLGFMIPECKKEVGSTTTSAPIEAAKELVSYEEAMKSLLGVIEHLRASGVNRDELRRVRLLITSLRAYCTLYESWQRIEQVERRVHDLHAVVVDMLEERAKQAEGPEREKWAKVAEELKKGLQESGEGVRHGV